MCIVKHRHWTNFGVLGWDFACSFIDISHACKAPINFFSKIINVPCQIQGSIVFDAAIVLCASKENERVGFGQVCDGRCFQKTCIKLGCQFPSGSVPVRVLVQVLQGRFDSLGFTLSWLVDAVCTWH
jgi:hypothetical protein